MERQHPRWCHLSLVTKLEALSVIPLVYNICFKAFIKAQGFFCVHEGKKNLQGAAAPQHHLKSYLIPILIQQYAREPRLYRVSLLSLAGTSVVAFGSYYCQSQQVSPWGESGGVWMDTQSSGSRASLLGCPHCELLAISALGRMKGPGALVGDLRRGCSGQKHCLKPPFSTYLPQGNPWNN